MGASGAGGLHTGQGLTEVGTHEAIVVSCVPGAAEGLTGLGVERVLPALRAGGDVQGPGPPGGGQGWWAGWELLLLPASPRCSVPLALCTAPNSVPPKLTPAQNLGTRSRLEVEPLLLAWPSLRTAEPKGLCPRCHGGRGWGMRPPAGRPRGSGSTPRRMQPPLQASEGAGPRTP